MEQNLIYLALIVATAVVCLVARHFLVGRKPPAFVTKIESDVEAETVKVVTEGLTWLADNSRSMKVIEAEHDAMARRAHFMDTIKQKVASL